MSKESIEKNISEHKPKTDDRDVWNDFHEYVHEGDVDKILELANFLHDHGREEDADRVLNRAYEIEGMNFKEKSKKILKDLREKNEGVDK